MKIINVLRFWSNWGIVQRLMAAVGFAILVGGGIQTYLLLVEGATEASARHRREMSEILEFLAPLVADQAILGDYEAIRQILNIQVKQKETDRYDWTDVNGRKVIAQDLPDKPEAPGWFSALAPIDLVEGDLAVQTGGVEYGRLYVRMTTVRAGNRLWGQFVKQLQIVFVTLFLMLQFIWLIFRGNLGTLRNLADGANRFSRGEHAVRILPEGALEVRTAAEAFNNMADHIQTLLASLLKSEAKNQLLAAIVEQSSEAMWTKDLSGNVTSWNAGAAEMFGYSVNEVVEKRITVGEAVPEVEAQGRMKRLQSGETFSYEIKTVTKSGTAIDAHVSVAPLFDANRKLIGKISIAHDVTERKRGEEELRAAREAAEAANRAKSSFLAKMSHEIRTPMNGVLGMTELLLEAGLTGVQRKLAETVQRSGKSLLNIINDILDFSKIEAGKLELEHVDVDLRRAVEDVVELLAESAYNKGLELVCTIPADLATIVKADPLRLSQILTNLTGNAIKFTERGEVVVRVVELEKTAEQVLLRFEVHDTGPGIDAEARERIFENFSQADGSTTRRHGGSGLGLAISKQLVEMMGGELRVESVLGAGSNFWFDVRFDQREPVLNALSDRRAKLAGMRTLIVQQNATIRNILKAQLGSWGMSAEGAATPAQALEMLFLAVARGTPYDVVILDLGLHGMGAMTLARTIKTDSAIANVRLLLLIPVGRHAEMETARQAGIEHCLSKPVRESALYDCLAGVENGSAETSDESAAGQLLLPTVAPPPIRGNILLAEDNIVNQEVARRMLCTENYGVTLVDNGLKALDALSHSSFDLVLMDCHMPELDGFEATRRIREREKQLQTGRIPIIAMTANAMQQDREQCLAAGMDDHLCKPYTRLQLRAVLNAWLSPDGSSQAPQNNNAEAAPPEPSDEILDKTALNNIRALQINGAPDVLERVINLYLDDTPKLLQKLKQAVAAEDAPEIERAAHKLKSSSATLGAIKLTQRCKELEALARLDSPDKAKEVFSEFEALYNSVQVALTAERGVRTG